MAPKFDLRRLKSASRGLPKKSQKIIPKSDPKGSPLGAQMGAKIDEKRCPKTGSTPRGVPGSPREPSGTILGAMFEYFWARFRVFPCVVYNILVKIGVFSRVYAVLSL